MTIKIDDADINKIRLEEQAGDPTNPVTGYGYLYAKDSGVYFKDDNGEVVGPFGFGIEPGGRLTLETGVPVSTLAQSAKTTLYYTPYKHNVISLYANSKWNPIQFTEKSITLVGLIASRPYDVWGYLSGGTLALELLAWTDGTNRATALARQDGMYIKSGDATRRYLGTICINSSGGQCEDTTFARFVWNYYNRTIRKMGKSDWNAHNYTTAVWRQWRGIAANKVEYVVGVEEDLITLSMSVNMQTTTNPIECGIARDTTTGAGSTNTTARVPTDDYLYRSFSDFLTGAIGYHYLSMNQYGETGATQTFITMAVAFLC